MAGSRDPWFDNIKMTLVTLVVVGHAWTLVPNEWYKNWAYDFLYAWHIPAFVIVTGYLSRSFAWTPAKLWSLVRTVAIPYVLFEAALAWFRYDVGGVELEDLFADPHWPMWYLSALFFWRLMTPAIRWLPVPVALGGSLIVSLVAGVWAGDVLDAARILGLLPFFVLGLSMQKYHWARIRDARTLPLALLGVAGVLAFTKLTDSWIATEWYYYRSRYDELHVGDLEAAAIRLAIIAVGLLGAWACFTLVPRAATWFSRLGAATLVVYLCHGFFVLSAQYEGFPDWTAVHPLAGFAITTVGAVLVAMFLAAPPVARALKVVVDPVGWLNRKGDQLSERGLT